MTDIRVERELAHAVRHAFDAPPRELFAVARRHFVDCAGVALAGAPAPAVSALRAALTAPASGSAASVKKAGVSISSYAIREADSRNPSSFRMGGAHATVARSARGPPPGGAQIPSRGRLH